ncbi:MULTISPECIES: recombinase family protein [Pseudomonas]|uniref:recombinase family protein n=1 Tax=Pseudomonas TaxID=286 RepID=UPI002911EBBF|nr:MULTISPECIES: recombinase family protein [Pseudomonas]MDU8545718.1 recombinase family protein [Pseudomonas syringae group sp. J248-6]WPP02585.1 recombinase family protein [Pseudomonas sp. HR96]
MRDRSDSSTPDLIAGGMRIGYARVSKQDQNLDLQIDALKAAGCTRIYHEKITGAKGKDPRPEQDKMVNALRRGDTVVVWQLSRLGRNLQELFELVNLFEATGVSFEVITERYDTATAQGRMIFGFCASLAAYERDRLIERTVAGLAAARARGRVGGRKAKLGDKEGREITALLADPDITVTDVARRYSVSRTTIYKLLNRAGRK